MGGREWDRNIFENLGLNGGRRTSARVIVHWVNSQVATSSSFCFLTIHKHIQTLHTYVGIVFDNRMHQMFAFSRAQYIIVVIASAGKGNYHLIFLLSA